MKKNTETKAYTFLEIAINGNIKEALLEKGKISLMKLSSINEPTIRIKFIDAALMNFKKAMHLGSDEAKAEYGKLLFDSSKKHTDKMAAFKLLQEAAENENYYAQYYLVSMLFDNAIQIDGLREKTRNELANKYFHSAVSTFNELISHAHNHEKVVYTLLLGHIYTSFANHKKEIKESYLKKARYYYGLAQKLGAAEADKYLAWLTALH